MIQQNAFGPNSFVLWVMGALFTLFTGLAFATLRSLYQQGRDTNAKVTTLAESHARLEATSSSSASEVTRLRDNLETVRNEVARIGGAHELAKEIVAVFTEATNTQRRRRREDAR